MKPRYKGYSDEAVNCAVAAVNRGCSILKAAQRYSIPKSTLWDKIQNRYCRHFFGPKPTLSQTEECRIVEWIKYLENQGFTVTKDYVIKVVSDLVKHLKRPTPFKDGVPGRQWLLNFVSRNPSVFTIINKVPVTRKTVTKQEVLRWFEWVTEYFEIHDMKEVLQESSRVYNCDETAFILCLKDEDESAKKSNNTAKDKKRSLRVLVNICADGRLAPPMIMFPYKRLPLKLLTTVPSEWGVGYSESWWINFNTFYHYITEVFYKWLLANQITLPVVLFMNGTGTHISLKLSSFCKEKGIILVALPPDSEHFKQPLDKVFNQLTDTWKKVVNEFRIKNNNARLKHTDFAEEMQKCFEESLGPDIIRRSFESSKIFPFNKDVPVPQHFRTPEEARYFRVHFEQRLSLYELCLFQNSGEEWEGEEQYRGLFEFWKNITQEEKLLNHNYSDDKSGEDDGNYYNLYDMKIEVEPGPVGTVAAATDYTMNSDDIEPLLVPKIENPFI